jgi:hypothetical protein
MSNPAPTIRDKVIAWVICTLAAVSLIGAAISQIPAGLFGYDPSTAAGAYSPNIDEAFVQAVAMQWELQPSGKTSVETSGNHFPDSTKMVEAPDEEYIDELPPLSDVDVRAFYTLHKPEIDKLWQKHKDWTLYDAVVTWGAIESVKRNGKPKQSAAAEGETTPAVTKGSAPPAVETPKLLFYEIILHTGKDCAPCDRLKHELKVRGYPFTEHLVSKGTVPTAFIDGEEFVGDAIYNRLKIVKLRKEKNATAN